MTLHIIDSRMKGLEPLMLGLKPKVLPIKLHSYITYNIILLSLLLFIIIIIKELNPILHIF